jgi:hypothetical protein
MALSFFHFSFVRFLQLLRLVHYDRRARGATCTWCNRSSTTSYPRIGKRRSAASRSSVACIVFVSSS